MKIVYMGLCLLIIFCCSNIIASEIKNEIELDVKKVVYSEKALEIEFEVKNLSKADIWVCASELLKEIATNMEVPIFRTIELNGGWIKIELISLIQDGHDVLFEGKEPWTRYRKLKSGETLKKKIVLLNPITEENDDKYAYSKPCKNTILSTEIKNIKLVIGYYTENININNCCSKEISKNPDICEFSFFCAQKNREKKITSSIYRNDNHNHVTVLYQ